MGYEVLKEDLPEYAKDVKLNLSSMVNTSKLTEQQLWGAIVATAIASRNPKVIAELSAEAKGRLSDVAYVAAKGAAAMMAMNNVYYRGMHLLGDPEYQNLRAGLRMNLMASHGVDKLDFELWSLAVSAINGCQRCLESHEQVLVKAGASRETVQEAVKIAAIVNSVAVTLEAEDSLA
ncbi:carboxymuconolactone decarboxylase family protein [Catenulispora subtropica]|uniref:Alkyl hydroperoxide reductase AhpD n=1 Tax=Catenulispora subtropica TaxID=450798 RepID=A0ABN2RP11_9ACTN